MNENNEPKTGSRDFIREIIDADLSASKNNGQVHTRFPPEPNGYLHIGHAKSICLNFGIGRDYNGKTNLRFDDTNPVKEDVEYVQSIKQDVHWLGFDWEDREFFASDYFEKLYQYALQLIHKGLAYVDSLTPDEIRAYRGTLTEPGKNSPYRDRSIEENLALFEKMKNGEFADSECILRAKIDMASPNMNLRDPAVYRIKHADHHRTGKKWCIYPMYDFAHGLSDAIEGITHSICTLEFEDHRPLYDWFLQVLDIKNPPRQIEFARLNLTYTVMSKRKLLALVQNKVVDGWDDPRMPTIAGLRRRGYTPESIREFADRIGVAKASSTVDIALLQHCLRNDLNKRALRRMAVIDPLKVIIENYPEGKVEYFDADNNPEDETAGTRSIPFSREIYIEKSDFMENPPKKFFRLAPGKEVRLKHAYYVTCTGVEKDKEGNVTLLRCTYDPNSRGGWTNDGRKVKGTSHWVSAAHAVDSTVRMYDHMFTREDPEAKGDFMNAFNHDSVQELANCKIEPCLADAKPGENFQFLRQGYFTVDTKHSKPGAPVFNLTVSLKDSYKG